MDKTKEKWEHLHTIPRFRPKYPSELVVQYTFQNFPDRNSNLLDLGAGAGRHTFFLASEGYRVMAADISSSGIEYVKQLVNENGLDNVDTVVAPTYNLPLEDESFDGCICYGVFYYMTKEEIQQSFKELYRVLKNGGRALVVVRTTDDHRYGQGREIEPNTFIIEEDDESKSSYHESGMKMHFFTREEIEGLTAEFSNVSIDRIDQTILNGKLLESNFIVKVIK